MALKAQVVCSERTSRFQTAFSADPYDCLFREGGALLAHKSYLCLSVVLKTAEMGNTVLTDLEAGILTITINRPEKMNALNREVIDELDHAVQQLYSNDEIKSALITGAGDKAFVAGADIMEFQNLSADEGTALSERGQRIFERIENAPKPFLAAVNGFALGGGCELAMACHLRIAAKSAWFGQPEVTLGLIPGYGGTQRLTRLVGPGRALEMMMTGEMITAARAWETGLANHITEARELLPFSRKILMKIQSKAPLAIAKLIHCVHVASYGGHDGFETERMEFGRCFDSEDLKEGADAFLQKRKPDFKGR